MLARLLILFLVVPLIELYLLLQFAHATNIPLTIAVVILTGVLGSMLAARQGANAIRNFQLVAAQGRIPGAEVVDGILIAFAAALLLSPGLLTDTLGILLLIPWSRAFFRKWLVRRFATSVRFVRYSKEGSESASPDLDQGPWQSGTVDGTFRKSGPDTDDEPPHPKLSN